MKNLTTHDYQHAFNVKKLLKDNFGDLIYQIYCYGSRVTQQQQDTDFDIIIITSEKVDWRLEDRISDLLYYYGLKNNILFDNRCFSRFEFENQYSYMPFISEIRNYGVAV